MSTSLVDAHNDAPDVLQRAGITRDKHRCPSVWKAAKRECSSVVSLADLERSPRILPAAEKMCSTPAEEAHGSMNI